MFAQFNRGKRALALDLKSAQGKADFLALVRGADAVVEGFRPGVLQRLGLDYAALAAVNPAIVLCSISGFRQDGPYADHAGHDLNYSCAGGLLVGAGAGGGQGLAPAHPRVGLCGLGLCRAGAGRGGDERAPAWARPASRRLDP